jgi:8-oxo-dGTP pyrophosphatase MutT (NUDIX family)
MNDARAALPEVAVGLIVGDDGRLLLQHRDANPAITGADMWGFFGGHIEPGERPETAFLREMREELGWQPRHFEHYLTREARPAAGDKRYGWHVISHVFAAHLDVPLDALTLNEGQALALYAPDALPATTVPSIVGIIGRFAASDAYKRVRRAYDIITATAILVDGQGRFLLQHRDDIPGIDNPGLWGSFGGRIEPYETPGDGFLRELREELSWEPEGFELYASAPYRPDERRQLIYVYAAPVDVPLEALVLGEGQALASFAPDALPAGTVPDYRALLARFAASEMYGEMVRRATAAA